MSNFGALGSCPVAEQTLQGVRVLQNYGKAGGAGSGLALRRIQVLVGALAL